MFSNQSWVYNLTRLFIGSITFYISKTNNMWPPSSPRNEGSFYPLPHREVSGSGPMKGKKKDTDHLRCGYVWAASMLRLGVFVWPVLHLQVVIGIYLRSTKYQGQDRLYWYIDTLPKVVPCKCPSKYFRLPSLSSWCTGNPHILLI
jgi:hypothetical protein